MSLHINLQGSLTIVQHALIDSRALLRMAVHLKLERYIVANAYSMLSEGAWYKILNHCNPSLHCDCVHAHR